MAKDNCYCIWHRALTSLFQDRALIFRKWVLKVFYVEGLLVILRIFIMIINYDDVCVINSIAIYISN